MTDEEEQPQEEQTSWAWVVRPFVSLSYPQFRLFWLSNLIVAVGMMVQFTARGWLVTELTNKALLLGAVEATWGITFALGSVPMGILADRFNRRDLLLLDNAVALSMALLIGLLVVTNQVAMWHILAAAALSGILFAGRFPAGQAVTAKLVPGEHLMNAISLNTAGHSLPNVAGPAAGGVLIGLIGIASAYFLTSGAFVLALLMMLGVAASMGHVERDASKGIREDFREAFDYIMAHKDLVRLTGAMLIPFILGQSYVLLLPLFVRQELHAGPEVFGALSACLGAGSVAGAMSVATFGKQRQIGLLMFAGVVGTGVCGVIYGFSYWIPLTAAVLLIAGASESALFAAYETVLVTRLPDEMRGRVMGLMFTLVAMFPISALAAGAIADVIGLRAVAVIEGLVIIALASVAWKAVLSNVSMSSD